MILHPSRVSDSLLSIELCTHTLRPIELTTFREKEPQESFGSFFRKIEPTMLLIIDCKTFVLQSIVKSSLVLAKNLSPE